MDLDIKQIQEEVERKSQFLQNLNKELETVIVGQKYMMDRLIIGLLADGHILLEGVPGLAKTLAVKSLASTINSGFQRIRVHSCLQEIRQPRKHHELNRQKIKRHPVDCR